MKKIILFTLILASLTACTGDRGPAGPPGNDGAAIVGQTFEFDQIYFNYEPAYNLWSTIIDIPSDIQVLDSDAILVYRLEVNGGVDTYSLIPQDFFLPEGTFEYVYNHTANDIELMIDGNFDLSILGTGFTDNQIFRFVVIPSDFANDPNVHLDTYMDLEATGIDFQEFK